MPWWIDGLLFWLKSCLFPCLPVNYNQPPRNTQRNFGIDMKGAERIDMWTWKPSCAIKLLNTNQTLSISQMIIKKCHTKNKLIQMTGVVSNICSIKERAAQNISRPNGGGRERVTPMPRIERCSELGTAISQSTKDAIKQWRLAASDYPCRHLLSHSLHSLVWCVVTCLIPPPPIQ